MFLRDIQKNVDALLESRRILLPEQIMQKHPHGVQPQRFGPAQFCVDPLRIESIRLPHLEFVDCIGRNVIAADEPWLLCIPVIRGLFFPTGRLRLRTKCKSEQ